MPPLDALLDILIVLLAAKVAAEGAERMRLPAVVGEILAGIVIGPSMLGLVETSDVLVVLGQIGVILLLLEVGLEMDLAELGAVGRAAMTVAVIGVVVPFAGGTGLGFLLGWDTNEAIFVGAALTATSVGISARVFGDLRALATVEARTVLGAAVADDVLGLVILTVVVRVVEAGSVSPGEVGSILAVAIGFLVVSIAVGIRFVPPLFAAIARHSRSAGTLVAVALAFALGVAELADRAKLAPIVGAFVAGIAFARSPVSDRVRRELAPVGHLFIPVFFLQIGIDTDVSQFLRLSVLGIAGLLLVVAVVGKLVAAAGLLGRPGDRLLVGIGMIPRGEVGLIFATIGLNQNVFGDDVYAALLLVVLVTTLVTPPLLRLRLLRIRSSPSEAGPADPKPEGGWLRVEGDTFDLAARPPHSEALVVGLRAALLGQQQRPGSELLDWLGGLSQDPLEWTEPGRRAFFALLVDGGPRSWRFLTITGLLARAVPELDEAVSKRAADPYDLDPVGALRWPRLGGLRDLGALEALRHPERVALAAVLLDAAEDSDRPVDELARSVAGRLGFESATDAIVSLCADDGLLLAAARRVESFSQESVVRLADHLGSAEQVRALRALTFARGDAEGAAASAVDALVDLLASVLARPHVFTAPARVEDRRAAALRLVDDPLARDALESAPSTYVLSQSPLALARQANLCSPSPRGDQVRVAVTPAADNEWLVEIAAADRIGLLAHEARVLRDVGFDVLGATTATWPDGCALAVLTGRSYEDPSPERLKVALAASFEQPLATSPTLDVSLAFDDFASPWHTLCEVRAADRFGLLTLVSAGFAAAGATVHAARITTVDGEAVDQFELTDARGAKLGPTRKEAIRNALRNGVTDGRRGKLRAQS